jgi:hypothetical protein
MSTSQYTIRNIPPLVDRYLRKRAKISGKSLNQVVIDELAEKAGVSEDSSADSLDWFYGSNTIDEGTIKALKEDDKIQKELTRKQWEIDDLNRY